MPADLQAGNFLVRQLQQMLPEVLIKRYRTLPFDNGDIVPTKADLQPGAASMIQEQLEFVGSADIIADEAIDIPLADSAIDEVEYKIVVIMAAFHITMRQLQAAMFAKVPLRDRKMFAARRAIAEKANAVAAYGSPKYNMKGFLTDPNVPLEISSFNPYAGGTTPDDLVGFFLDEVTQIITTTLATESPNTVLVPHSLYQQLIKTRLPNTQANVLSYILETSNYIENIVPIIELRSDLLEANGVHATGTGQDRIVVYPLSDEIVERHIEVVKPLPEEYRNVKYIIPMYTCVTETMWHYPKAGRYVDIIKSPTSP